MTVAGPQTPSGVVRVSGAKNAGTRLMAAAMLTTEKVTLLNFPTELVDARHKARFIADIGGEIILDDNLDQAEIKCGNISAASLTDFNYPIRTTYLLAAGQLHRSGVAFIPYPGGCNLGARKYDLHLMVWEALGCEVLLKENHIEIRCAPGGLRGSEIVFPITTVGGTENAVLCAAVAKGTTRIRNAYITPEITNLIELMELMGARIHVHGVSEIVVEGVDSLRGATCRVMADRIEALTWIIYAALSGGDILIEDVPFESLDIPLIHLQAAGIDIFRNKSAAYVSPKCFLHGSIQPFEVACGTHPGVISDMQPFYTLLAMKGAGRSLIVDYRYPERVGYLNELQKFAPGSLSWEAGLSAVIRVDGTRNFQAANANSTDLRGSMAVVLAALLAEGESRIDNVGMALRGYNNLAKKLAGLGVVANFSYKEA